MAKIKLNHLFESVSGKLCKKGSTYVALNKRTGKMYSAEYHEHATTNTEALQDAKAAFTKKSQFAASWWASNKPAKEGTLGTDAYQKVIKAYKQQTKIGNPYSYLRSLVTDDLKVMLGTTDLTNGTTAGGGSSSGGTSSGGGLEG